MELSSLCARATFEDSDTAVGRAQVNADSTLVYFFRHSDIVL